MTRQQLVDELFGELSVDAPRLTEEDCERLADNARRWQPWAASTAVSVGERFVSSAQNGRVYIAVQAGTTGATEPGWPLFCRHTRDYPFGFLDGSVRWRDGGPAHSEQYDRRAALRAGWLLKAKRTAQLVDVQSGPDRAALSQKHQQFLAIADRYSPVFAV